MDQDSVRLVGKILVVLMILFVGFFFFMILLGIDFTNLHLSPEELERILLGRRAERGFDTYVPVASFDPYNDFNGDGLADLLLTMVQNVDPLVGEEGDYWCYKTALGLDIANGAPSGGYEDLQAALDDQGGFIRLGDSNNGGGAAVGDINKNFITDVVLMSVDYPIIGLNEFRFVVGLDMDPDGTIKKWSGVNSNRANGIPDRNILGNNNIEGGVAVGDIDRNGFDEIILAGIDPSDEMRYAVGRDLNVSEFPTLRFNNGWAYPTPVGGLKPRDESWAGAGAALGDIDGTTDGNQNMDLVFFTIDNNNGEWKWVVLREINISGDPTQGMTSVKTRSVTPAAYNDEIRHGGITLKNVNHNDKLDLVVSRMRDTDVSSLVGKFLWEYAVGFDLDPSTGDVAFWSPSTGFYQIPVEGTTFKCEDYILGGLGNTQDPLGSGLG